jgi:plastocyanin domain-containing protein
MYIRAITLISLLFVFAGGSSAETPVYEIIIKDHKFDPEEIKVPAGQKVKLRVHNQDPTPEEFESHDMGREKIIGGGKKATIFVGPLEPGKYHFFGEFNMDTANGYIIAE